MQQLSSIPTRNFTPRTQYNPQAETATETVQGVSLTVPDESYTPAQLLERYAQGLSLGGHRQGYYSEDSDLDDEDLEKMSNEDIFIKEQILANAKNDSKQFEESKKQTKAKKETKHEEPQEADVVEQTTQETDTE